MILTNRSLSWEPVALLPEYQHLEVVAVDVFDRTQCMRFITVYIPPAVQTEHLNNTLECVRSLMNGKEYVVGGDFNLGGINWLTYQGFTECQKILVRFILDEGLFQLVAEPTHTHLEGS